MRTRNLLTAIVLGALSSVAACSSAPDDAPSDTSQGFSSTVHVALPFGFDAAWEDTGVVMDGAPDVAPTVASWGANRLDMFTRSNGNLVQHMWSKGSGWSGPATLATGVASDASASTWNGNRLDLAWRANDGSVERMYWNGSKWLSESLGGRIDGKPSIVITSQGFRGDVFARAGGMLWHRGNFLMTTWGAWESLGLAIDSDPVAVSSAKGRIDVFWRANDGSTRRYSWDGRTTVSGGDGSLYGSQLAGKRWATMASLGGYAKDPPSVAVRNETTFEVFVRGGDDRVYRNASSTYPTFAGWNAVGAACSQGTPAAVANDYRHVDLVVRDETNNHVMRVHEGQFPSGTAGAVPVCCGHTELPICINQPPSGQCDSGMGVDTATNRCLPCGRSGDVCCNLGGRPLCNDPNQGCNRDPQTGVEMCEWCGTPTTPACSVGTACPMPYTQLNAATNHCDHCGDPNERACGGHCNFAPANVTNGICLRPPTCGVEGLDCCNESYFHGSCGVGLTCIFRVFEPNVCRKSTAANTTPTGAICGGGVNPADYHVCVQCTYVNGGSSFDDMRTECSQAAALAAAVNDYGNMGAGETCSIAAGPCTR